LQVALVSCAASLRRKHSFSEKTVMMRAKSWVGMGMLVLGLSAVGCSASPEEDDVEGGSNAIVGSPTDNGVEDWQEKRIRSYTEDYAASTLDDFARIQPIPGHEAAQQDMKDIARVMPGATVHHIMWGPPSKSGAHYILEVRDGTDVRRIAIYKLDVRSARLLSCKIVGTKGGLTGCKLDVAPHELR